MMALENVIEVSPNDGNWKVRRSDRGEVLGPFSDKQAAIEIARELALACQPSKLVIIGRDGSVQNELTYGRSDA